MRKLQTALYDAVPYLVSPYSVSCRPRWNRGLDLAETDTDCRRRMLRVFKKSGLRLSAKQEAGIVHIALKLS